MSSIYQINFTDSGIPGFTINPAGINGPGNAKANTSLTLHGTGRIDWGEKVNSNFVKLLETSSSPANTMPQSLVIKTNTATLPDSSITIDGDVSNIFNPPGFQFDIIGSAIAGSYTVKVTTYLPGTNETLIVINGGLAAIDPAGDLQYTIIEPDPLLLRKPYIQGQLWYNKNDSKAYVYKVVQASPEVIQWRPTSDGSVFFANAAGAPLAPLPGTLWYNSDTNQLFIWDPNVGTGEWVPSGDVHFGGTQPNTVPSAGQLWYNNITRQLLVWNSDIGVGGEWNATGDVTVGFSEPNTTSSDGQLWLDTNISSPFPHTSAEFTDQLKIFNASAGGFISVGARYLLRTGSTLLGDGAGGLAETTGVLNFNNNSTNYMQLGQSQGVFTSAPDIKWQGDGYLASGGDLRIGFGGIAPGNSTAKFEMYHLADNFDILDTSPGTNTAKILEIDRFTVEILPDSGDDGFIASTSVINGPGMTVPNKQYVKRVTEPIGTILMWGAGTIPFNPGINLQYLPCDGAAIGSADPSFVDLFAIIGYTWGGAGAVFNVPDLDGEFIVGAGSAIGVPTLPQERLHVHFNGTATVAGIAAAGADLSVPDPFGTTGNSAVPIGITLGTDYRPQAMPVRYYIKYRNA